MNRTWRVAVLASGKGSNLARLLAHAADGTLGARITLVVSDRPDAPCLQTARQEVPAVLALPPTPGESRAAYDQRLHAVLEAEAPDLIVLAGFMRILGPRVCRAFAGRIINLHPALLPSYRGARAVQAALAGGARITGCTTHFVTEELDAGPIILQAACAVGRDGVADLRRRVQALEHVLLPWTVRLFVDGRIDVQDGRVVIAPGPAWPLPDTAALWPEV